MEEENARTIHAGYILQVIAGWRMPFCFEQCQSLKPVLPHHPWHNIAMGSILLLPMSLASQACCLEQEPCHLIYFICKAFITAALCL